MPVRDQHLVSKPLQLLIKLPAPVVVTMGEMEGNELGDIGIVGDLRTGLRGEVLGSFRLCLVAHHEGAFAEEGMRAPGKPGDPVDVLRALAEIGGVDQGVAADAVDQ